MKKQLSIILIATLGLGSVWAGNPDRAGSAGASQLLINPWAASNGLVGANMASIVGLESVFTNVAGLAFIGQTQLITANSLYLGGSGISLNSVGFGTRVGSSGVLGITVTSMKFGDIPIMTEDLPEGGIGTFSPSFSNIGVSYAKEFSNSIYAGLTMRIIGESISNVKASGIAFDAGIRYVTGENDRMRFGISLRNVGPPMRYAGDGLTVTATPQGATGSLTVLQRSERYELPSLLNLGLAYDVVTTEDLVVELNGMFTSNSFTKDQFGIGAETRIGEKFAVRAGYMWEQGFMQEGNVSTTAYTGPAGGLSINLPAGSSGSVISLDYSYRTTNPFNGTHSVGLKISM
ncbi:MAG TPA: PorV/PorQ family protein [Flavobacteriales bacterium]|nr:PorV/PorQ family protein [Flavobacteriales bacterium]